MFIRKLRKKHYFMAGLAGALFMAIPLAGVILYLLFASGGIINQEGKGNEEPYREVWRLTTALSAGEAVTAGNMEPILLPMDAAPAQAAEKEAFLGRKLKLNLESGTILTQELVYRGENFADDMRLHDYGFVKLTDKLKKGDYVDVRIAFPNGADCIVLSKKKVLDLSLYSKEDGISNSLWLEVGEEEILRLSSAVVDASLWEGSSIYAMQYTAETQQEAAVTYPVNETVLGLMKSDPNVVARAQAVVSERLRKTLDTGAFMDAQGIAAEEEGLSADAAKTDSRGSDSGEETFRADSADDQEITYLD